MPTYTTINNLQVPVGSDPPNAETATHPVAKGAERRCFNVIQNEAFLPDFLPDPSEGMAHFNIAHTESLIFRGGRWRALTPRWLFLGDPVLVTGTSFVTVLSFVLQPSSIYKIEGTLIFFSEDDPVQWRLVAPSGSFWRLENSLGGHSQPATYAASEFNQGVTLHAATIVTPAGDDTTVEIQARKTTDTGADADVFEGFVMLQRFGAWQGV